MEQTRELVFRAVCELLADEDSGEELTIPRIAERAGMSVRTVYRHFSSREELSDAFADWAERRYRLVLRSYPDTLEGVRELAPALYRSYEENATLVRAMLASNAARPLRLRTRRHRLDAVRKALADVTSAMSPEDRRRACAVVYLLVSAPAWQAMRDQWGLAGEDAGEAAAWAIRVLTDELRRSPASLSRGRPAPPDRRIEP
jgi:AcrR family transcriptional regulator